MDDNNLIVLGLDLSKTKIKFDVQLKHLCQNISDAQTAKIALSLDVGKTTANFKQQLNSILSGINTAETKTQQPIDNLNKSLLQTDTVTKSAASSIKGNFTNSLAHSTTKMLGMLAVLKAVQLAIGSVKAMFNNVIELDRSLTELAKVTDLTGSQLKAFTDKAYDAATTVGRTGIEIVSATSNFKKAGYELKSSLELAKSALIMTNVGDGIQDVTEASSALISVLRGFNINDADALQVVDRLNEVSNNSPVDFDNLTDGLKRVSGTLAQTGASIDETIGLLVGGFSQLRNMETVSSALVFISQRLRGIGEDGESIDGLAPKIAQDFKDIANIDIEDANGGLRSTYDILQDMARVFPTLTEKQQQYLGEMSAGNRNIKVLNAILQQWQDVDNAVEQSNNSMGSATKENDVYRNSIAGVRKELESAFQDLSQTVVDSDWIKESLKTLTSFIKLLTDLAENPLVQSLITGSLIMAVPKIFSGLKGIGSFFSDYKSMVSMIVHGNTAVEQSNAKVGKSFGEFCKKNFMSKSCKIDFINTPTYFEVA